MTTHNSNTEMLGGGGKPWTRLDSIKANRKRKKRRVKKKNAQNSRPSSALRSKGRGVFGRVTDALR